LTQGLVQIYTGNGKGKTTAAVGLAVRALGQDLRVLLARFLKPHEPVSGEVLFLREAPNLEILTAGVGIVGRRPDLEEVRRSVGAAFDEVRDRIDRRTADLVVLDEINNVLHHGYLPLEEFLDFIDNRPAGVELVLTGRNAPDEVLERADLVTRMEPLKHPLQAGIAARRGIEY